MEFTKKTECDNYCQENNLAFFQRDLNEKHTKIFVADTYENLFNKIKLGNANLYESWNKSQNMKLFIDYDKKVEQTGGDLKKRAELVDDYQHHKTDILNIINVVRTLIPNITAVNVLKSIPDITKKSYHIVFEGIHFKNCIIMKSFVDEQLKPKLKELFEKKIFDSGVYNGCLRSILCNKLGQNRPLYILKTDEFLNELHEAPISRNDTTYKMFLKTCITYIEPDSVLYNYKTEKKKNNSKKVHLMAEEDIYSDKEITRKYLDILDPDRFTDYNKWIHIGFMLYSINCEFIDLWHYFSSKYEFYDEQLCNSKWISFANSEYIYTINNLIYLARIDNPDECNNLSKDIPNHDIKYLRPFDNVLSKLIFRLYCDKFICSSPEKKEWYYFNGQRWKKENKSFNLRHRIINEVFTKIENYRRQLIREGASDDIIKNYHNILKLLGSGIQFTCLELEFYNENFYKIIDQNKDLLGFENGVLDLRTLEFRPGVCADYISLSTGYEYQTYSEDDPLYIDLMNLLIQIFPHPDTRHFTLKSLASCLDGHNRDENFYIWSGKNGQGGSGKSTITTLAGKALGDYAIESPVSLLTGKRESSNSANPALIATRNKRLVVFQEPGANDLIQSDTLKLVSGGDQISARDNYSGQVTWTPHAKYIMPCNKLPSLSSSDGGTARRIKISEFISVFVPEPCSYEESKKKGIYEFKIDNELKTKLDIYKPVFINILLNYYKIYKKEGLIPPETVMKVTKKYENNNNTMKTFIEENFVKGTKKDFILREDIKELYKNDYSIRASFPKISNFLTQIESALCTEFKLDNKSKVFKIEGYSIKRPGAEQIDDEDNESEYNSDFDI
jgi:P4 family phage/plasmid primase-like protien